ncbi:MAG: hypothetical protein QOH57_566 [Mycobacterium sp.]|nr:hypothetical protein [Mycobacterium sp.]
MMHPMDPESFERSKAAIIRRFPASEGDDLLGMEIDFVGHLGGLAELDGTSVRRTNDPFKLIVADAIPNRDATPEQVGAALEEVWVTKLRYPHAESHVLTRGDRWVRLDAFTQISPEGFFVTAEITARWQL